MYAPSFVEFQKVVRTAVNVLPSPFTHNVYFVNIAFCFANTVINEIFLNFSKYKHAHPSNFIKKLAELFWNVKKRGWLQKLYRDTLQLMKDDTRNILWWAAGSICFARGFRGVCQAAKQTPLKMLAKESMRRIVVIVIEWK